MADKRSRYSSARDRPSSIIGDTSRTMQENFATDFLTYCEQYNVEPLPRIIAQIMDVRISSFSFGSREETDDETPTFYVTYDGRKIDAPKRMECKVSICILDAVNVIMQKYNTITVLKLPNCRINAFGIMQIAEMLVNIGCLRDLNLDMNPNPQENYHLLCTPSGNLLYLSLNLCEISDNGIKKIAEELKYQDHPNDPRLLILSLSNNHITNVGAIHIRDMLRTNRSLKSLNLLGNHMEDEGASLIIKELKMITLSHEEIVGLRRRKFAELTLREELMKESLDNESVLFEEDQSRRNSKTRLRNSLTRRSRKSQGSIASFRMKREGSILQDSESRREMFLEGEKCHPFRVESYPMNGSIMATGNLELQHLDLSYNNLTNDILDELVECLYYQNYMLLGDRTKGLLYILVEGGNITKDNRNWTKLEELLIIRQNSSLLTIDDFHEFVPEESEMLRGNVKILTRSQDKVNSKRSVLDNNQ